MAQKNYHRKHKNKGKIWLRRGLIVVELLVLVLLAGAVGLFYNKAQKKQAAADFSWDDYPTTVHALGGLDGKTYLNSKEGFEYYYEKGSRLFEVDLAQTADGIWVCRAAWKHPVGQWKGNKRKVLMSEAFKNTLIYDTYTPLTLEDLFQLLQRYPDAYALIDCKEYSTRNYQNTLEDYTAYAELARSAGAEGVLDQMIPELYNEEMYEAVKQVHDFPSYMYSLWQEYSMKQLKNIAAYCKENKIPIVTINAKYWTEEIQEMFDKHDVKVYIYTVNDASQAKQFISAGAVGVCTDTLLDKDLQ